MTTITTAADLSKATIDAILASVEMIEIESFDYDDAYSTNIHVDVTIDGTTYTVYHQRGTDGDVNLAPFSDSGLPEVYLALMTLAGERKDQDVDDMRLIFDRSDEEAAETASHALHNLAHAVEAKIARVAEAAQDEYDEKREAGEEV
ncbi:hypothetical protein QZM81_19475 [Burkholderia cepacia]|uniref:hypothetical protein n=1 Tax=Burkholderia cepacia TaxID=292 RepID=UPI002653AF8D|nr:hypothetical protein [Burkholderia cepacia]MDN7857988.1 hypothetical protein [Burkholderia cepacia]